VVISGFAIEEEDPFVPLPPGAAPRPPLPPAPTVTV
jgi:hypothetical protein